MPIRLAPRIFAPRAVTTTLFPNTTRAFTTNPALRARKDAQDKDSIVVESNEYSKTGSDAASASATEEAAFDSDKTRPEEEFGHAEKEAKKQGTSNPLDGSPANQEINQPRQHGASGNEGSTAQAQKDGNDRARSSGGGSAPKSGGKRSGGGGAF